MRVVVKYVTKIPSQAVEFLGLVFNGGVKSTIIVTVDLSKNKAESILRVKRSWGESRSYSSDDILTIDGKPSWFKDLKPGASVTARETLRVKNSNLKATFYQSVSDHGVALYVAGGNPLLLGSPDIDGEFYISLKKKEGSLAYQIYGKHDGFPDHLITIDDKVILHHDSVALNQGPASLGPPAEFIVSERVWKKL